MYPAGGLVRPWGMERCNYHIPSEIRRRVVAKSASLNLPFGQATLRSLAPPFPTKPAPLGFGGDPIMPAAALR